MVKQELQNRPDSALGPKTEDNNKIIASFKNYKLVQHDLKKKKCLYAYTITI
jgi:hypothetical protein